MSDFTEMRKAHTRNISFRQMAAVLDELFIEGQDYTECLLQLVGIQYTVENCGVFEITNVSNGTRWKIESSGASYVIRFDVVDGRVCNIMIPISYCMRAEIIDSLTKLVLDIVTTYHPDGKKLF